LKVAVGCDHAGLILLDDLRKLLAAKGVELLDFGTHSFDSVDYPDYAHKVAHAVSSKEADLGLLVCGTGLGMCMAANRHPKIRAAECTDSYMARMARMHNDANVLCIGARVVGAGVAHDIVETFLGTQFESGRHQGRVEKIEKP
jgi:ribose 5-phosphate isomerase B